jgi:DNA-binding CsgD family transcriptional regulator
MGVLGDGFELDSDFAAFYERHVGLVAAYLGRRVVRPDRQAECERIARLLEDARRGRSGVLVIRGEPGVGKSALLGHAVELSKGMRLLRARGVESEAAIPFAGLFELLRPAVGAIDRIPTPQAASLRGALGLGPVVRTDRFMIGAATLSVLAAVAEDGPLLVAVDDAHWLDQESSAALSFAVRRLEFDAVATVVASREGGAEAFGGAGFSQRTIEPFDQRACGELLRRRLGHAVSDAAADRLYAVTRGNALALVELAHLADTATTITPVDATERPETTLERIFARRIDQLSQMAQRLLLVAAIDEPGEMRVVGPAARSLELDVSALGEAEADGLVALSEGRVVFRHPLVRSAAERIAPAAERRSAHRAVANAIGAADPMRRAWHMAAAAVEPDEAVAAALERGADSAQRRGGHAAASTALARAAALTPSDQQRGRRLFAAAGAAWLAGESEAARALADEVLLLCDDETRLADVHYLRGSIALEAGQLDEALAILVGAGFDAAAGDAEKAAPMIAKALEASVYAGRGKDKIAIARAASELVHTNDARVAFWSSLALGWALLESSAEDEREGRRLFQHALDGFGQRGLPDDPHLLSWASVAAGFGGDYIRAVELAYAAVGVARRERAVGALPLALSVAADYSFCAGNWARALAEASEGARIAQETGQASEALFCASTMMIVAAARGSETECNRRAAQVRARAADLGIKAHTYDVRALGLLALGQGAPDEAIGLLEPVVDLEVEQAHHLPGPGDGFDLVEAHARAGRGANAADALAKLERSAILPYSLGAVARCRGLLAPESDVGDSFVKSSRIFERLALPFHVARTRLCFGERLRRAGQRIAARQQLREALEIFERLDADCWAHRTAAELRASGERRRSRESSDREELTPQELQIALIVAEGKTNKEIGATLFLSPKTVETHLGRIYRKLGITSRARVIHALAQDETRASR